jgi:8-oxo-dGTP pyrophosphatase MutT (NUDIX family)
MAGDNGAARLVKAAGGVVWRVGGDGVEVLVVHRPNLQDWSFPKGKLEPGDDGDETHCALREVLEETGYRCTLGRELPSIGYTDAKGRPKRVRYWEMTVVDGAFTPNREVDEVRWSSSAAARALLSYDRDRDVLDAFLAFAQAD